MEITPSFRRTVLDVALKISERSGGEKSPMASRLFEHVEHIVHGRKSYDAPHLGAEAAMIADNNVREATFSLLVAVEALRYGATSDAESLLGDAASLLGIKLST